jgi:quinoprotein glucose dehydrogenase
MQQGYFCLLLLLFTTTQSFAEIPSSDWPVYGGDTGNTHYSALTQITPENINKLKIAWIYHTRNVSHGKGEIRKTTFENTPIIVDNT